MNLVTKGRQQTVKNILLKHPLRLGAASAIVAGGVLGGAVAFAATGSGSTSTSSNQSTPAATPSQSTTQNGATPAKKSGTKHPRVLGKVVNVSTSGGLSNLGTVTVAEPDGHQTTFSISSTTKAWKYQGQGEKPVKESPTSIPDNEVIVAGLQPQQGGVSAKRIVDTGFQAS